MPIPTLPDELLLDLFGSLTHPNDLAHSLYSAKAFAKVVRPLLYAHIKIEKKQQRARLLNIREDDAKFIKKVSIVGSTNVWNARVEDLDQHFDGESISETEGREMEGGKGTCELGEGCVREVFEGKLFKVDAVESIVVENVHEAPRIELQRLAICPSLLHNLHYLSIISHRGGAHLWESVLKKKHLPSLRRLTIYDVTSFLSTGSIPPRQTQVGGQTILSLRNQEIEMLDLRNQIREYVVTENILSNCDLLDQLEILVSPEYPFLSNYPNLSHLAILAEDANISATTKYAILFVGRNGFREEELYHIFDHLDTLIARSEEENALEYLSLNPDYDEDYWDSHYGTLDEIVEKGVKIFLDGNESAGLIPQSFLKAIAEKRKTE